MVIKKDKKYAGKHQFTDFDWIYIWFLGCKSFYIV